MTFPYLQLVGGFSLSVFFILILTPVARKIGWLDSPCTRKQHHQPIPLTGGVAMCLAFVITLLATEATKASLPLLAAMLFMCLVGLLDDLYHLSARIRIVLQLCAGIGMCIFDDMQVTSFGDIFGTGPVAVDNLSLLFTIFCIVGGINAINMIDGMDGLAGSVVLAALFWLGFLAGLASMETALATIVTMAACVIGYLCFNMRHPWRQRASIFMGDAGSTMLGVALVWFIISLSQEGTAKNAAFPPVVGLWLVAIPLVDTLCLILRRVLRGHSPFSPDRHHLHHLIQRQGISDAKATLIIAAAALSTGAIGSIGWLMGLPEYILFYGFLAFVLAYYLIVHHYELKLFFHGKPSIP